MSCESDLPSGISAELRERFAKLSVEEQARVLARLAESRARRTGSAGIPRNQRSRAPLTPAQQGVWFLQQLETDSPMFNQSHVWGLRGPLDVGALQRSLAEVVRRHEILRTRYVVVDGEPVQEVIQPFDFALETFDARGTNAQNAQALADFCHRIALAPFDLGAVPMLRAGLAAIAADQHRLIITRHHIASDRWSAGVFLRELAALYEAFSQGQGSPLTELPIQYTDYAVWSRERAFAPAAEGALADIVQRLADVSDPTTLVPGAQRATTAASYRGGRLVGGLPNDVVSGLRRLAHAHGATLFMGLLAVFKALVFRYTGRTDLTICTPIAGRRHTDIEPLIGLFANILALRTDLSGDPTFVDLLGRVRAEAVRAFEHQEIAFERVLESLRPGRTQSIAPLTRLIFALQNVEYDGLRLAGVEVESLDSPLEAFSAELALLAWEDGERFVLRADYRADLFDAAFVRRMFGHFATLATAVVANPAARLSDLDLLTSEERDQLIRFNATTAAYPAGRRIEELFEEHALSHPEAIAVVDGARQVSYGELNNKANQIAARLTQLGVNPRDRVALLLHGTWQFIAAVLGAYKAGAAYVAIDPQHPRVRRDLLLHDARPAAAIAMTDPGAIPALTCPVVVLEESLWSMTTGPAPDVQRGTSEDVACVLYTSGSTGVPKGVLMPHRAVVNHSWWMAQVYGAGPAERVLQASPCSFDASMWEITMPLITGGAVVVGPPLGRIDPPDFLRAIRDGGITSLLLVPAQIPSLLQRPELDQCVSLRHVFVGGEVFPARSAALLANRIAARVHNIYGPTETCVNSTMQLWEPSMGNSGTVPIGRPIGNTEIYVLDARNRPVPIGIPGELCIAGEGVAHGYLNAPDLTAQRFVPHPFAAGRKMYRTGDRARWRDDGSLDFLGRLDDQFKVRGNRIEPGEIEAALVGHSGIHAAAVAIRGNDDPESAHLVAFLVPAPNTTARPGAATLRAFLRERLPEAMVPATYRWIDALPLNSHGKVARAELPDVAPEMVTSPAPSAETDTEQRLTALWAEILQQPGIELDSHFFDAGGHSMLAVRLFTRIEEEFGTRLRMSKLFEAPTIRLLARVIDSAAGPASSPIVPIRAGGSWPPLYIVHGIGGEVLAFEALARHLPAEQPVFGFEAPIPALTDSPDVVQTAQRYVELLVRAQPQGPYLLSGYSWGGPLAFEMACRLVEADKKVGLLLLIDGGLPGVTRRTLQRPPLPVSAYVRHLAYWLVDDLFATPPAALAGRIKSKLRLTAAKAAHRVGRQDSEAAALDVRDRLGTWRFPEAYRPALEKRWQAFESHDPSYFPGRLVVIRSRTGPFMRPRRPVSGWETLADSVEYHVVAGSHGNILVEPRVKRLAAIVAAAIERAVGPAQPPGRDRPFSISSMS